MTSARVRRTRAEKEEIVAYAAEHTIAEACEKFAVAPSSVYLWKRGEKLGTPGRSERTDDPALVALREAQQREVLEMRRRHREEVKALMKSRAIASRRAELEKALRDLEEEQASLASRREPSPATDELS